MTLIGRRFLSLGLLGRTLADAEFQDKGIAVKEEHDGEVEFSYRDTAAYIEKVLAAGLGDRLPSVLTAVCKLTKPRRT